MSQETTPAVPPIVLRRTFVVPREIVFDAWTDPDALTRWWGPHGYTTPDAMVDLRVGGRYRLTTVGPQGNTFYLYGTYREVKPQVKLVYTWNWEGTTSDGWESLVSVEFHERGPSATEVVITHDCLRDHAMRDEHARGWSDLLDRLGDNLF